MSVASSERGFTLIEVMVVVAIIAILAMIALPSYQDYLRRGQIAEGVSALSEARIKMEQYFQDNRTYVSGGVGAYPCSSPPSSKYFTFACSGQTTSAFKITATGKGNLTGFAYDINQSDVRTSTTPWGSGTCWVTRKGDQC